jgi:hypothetical protein
MKRILFLLMALLTLNSYGQDKYKYAQFNKLTEVEGTNFIIATNENWSKLEGPKNRRLLFIDTKSGQTNQVDLENGGYFEKIKQVKIDELGINKLVVSAHAIDLDGKKGIDWNDPEQLIILSTDGKEKTQLTDSKVVRPKLAC